MNKVITAIIAAFPFYFATVDAIAAVPEKISGMVKGDGSSTVYPIAEAVAEEFGKVQRNVRVTVGISGTGGGFKKFCAGETDISNASRPIKKTEIEQCAQNGIEYVELPVAYDALSVVVNPANDWVTSITVKELKKIWEPEAHGKIMTWNQIRPEWPDRPIKLYGPGVDSGTFDYFTEAIVGKEHASRGDFTGSEDDNTLVQGVANDVNALAFFGLAYYEENKDKLKLVLIDDEKGKGPQLASVENVRKGVYQPLSRPLFIYIAKNSLSKPQVSEFANFYMKNVSELSAEVGYVPLNDNVLVLAQAKLEKGATGSIFAEGGSQVGIVLEEVLSAFSKDG